MDFRDAIKTKRLYFDGAMGTMIGERLGNIPKNPSDLNITHPEIIRGIHQDYVDAGADIILTNTFGANAYKMADSSYSVEEVISAAVSIARSVKPNYVCLDIGPLGTLVGSMGDVSFEEAIRIFKRSVVAGTVAGVDAVILGTMTDLYETKAAMIAVKEVCDLPIIASLTFEASGRTLTGTDPLTAVTVLEALGADVIGINCSMGPDQMMPIIDELLAYAHVPIAVQPNAGLPRVEEGKTIFDVSPEEFGEYMVKMSKKGVALLGGCCGTTPEHIKKLTETTKNISFFKPKGGYFSRVSSGAKTLTLGRGVKVIGERINPSGSKKLKEDLLQGSIKVLKGLALQQVDAGADILDVNLGLPNINESVMMTEAVEALNILTDTPLQLDATDPEVLEAGLRCVNGKPIINSVNGTEESLSTILPLAKKYGACVLGLTIDEQGLPQSTEERIVIAERIMDRALVIGIPKEDVLFDCLTLTVSAEQKSVHHTLNAIKTLKERYGSPMVLGVSNVSFGLPNRKLINKTFLVMAMAAGLDTPIMNPEDREMMDAVTAYRALSGEDKDCMNYISGHQTEKQQLNTNAMTGSIESILPDLKQLVVAGLKDQARELTETLLTDHEPMSILNDYLIPGLDQVGDDFEKGKCFLPNLMYAAETVQASFKVLKEHMGNQSQLSAGRILLATVQGDIHDIGKNILKVILENYGYDITDLGKDVAPQKILEAVQESDIPLVGLSALMTTTLPAMEETIALLHEQSPNTKIMVGGAVLNETYAQSIGADYYGKDAKAGVEIARKVFHY